jgi:hypothetical protein
VLRKLLIPGLMAAAVVVPSAAAKATELMPSVTYQKQVQFTLHGPAIVHVLIAPRPGGLYSLAPALSNETVPATEKLTAIEQRLSPGATVAGVSGDRFTSDGRPIGVLMRNGVLEHSPLSTRSSVGIDSSGALHVDRVTLLGTVQGNGQRRPFSRINERAPSNGFSLFTPAWGPATPSAPGSIEVVLPSFPALAPNTELRGVVGQVSTAGGNTPIPPGGAVVVARGVAASKLAVEAPVGQTVTVRLILNPNWAGMVGALGGGPVLVRNHRPVFKTSEAFTTDVLTVRQPRAGVGQLADGRILIVAVDGGRPGYSTGMTNFELAQTMARLGAVTAAGLGWGSQVGLAFDGKLLSKPSGSETPISDALLVSYLGVYAPPPNEPVLSPNGDGVAETEQLAYKVVRPSTVIAQLVGPDGVARSSFSGQLAAGTYPLAFTGLRADGTPEIEGTWRWLITATDDLGRASTVERDFSLNLTLGFPKTVGGALPVPRAQPRAVASFNLTRAALVTPRIETTSGVVLRTLPRESDSPGTLQVTWDGVTKTGAVVYSGRYVAHVFAKNAIGTADLSVPFTVRRVSAGARSTHR